MLYYFDPTWDAVYSTDTITVKNFFKTKAEKTKPQIHEE